jgi:hypothetical protein
MSFVLDDVIGIKAEDDIGTVKVFKTLDDFLDFIEDINDSLKVEVVTDGSWEERNANDTAPPIKSGLWSDDVWDRFKVNNKGQMK